MYTKPAPLASSGMKVVERVKVVDNSWYNKSTMREGVTYDTWMGALRGMTDGGSGGTSFAHHESHSRRDFGAASSGGRNKRSMKHDGKVSSPQKKKKSAARISPTSSGAAAANTSCGSSYSYESEDGDHHDEDEYSALLHDDDERPESWHEKFQQLVEYKNRHGHCNPPQKVGDNPELAILANWVKRQRYHFKLKQQNKYNNLTPQRESALTKLGFVWDIRSIAWDDKVEELRAFITEHGHANVPVHYEKNRELGLWIKRQRRQYKLYCSQNKRTSMTAPRIAQLEELGFKWNAQRGRKKSTSTTSK